MLLVVLSDDKLCMDSNFSQFNFIELKKEEDPRQTNKLLTEIEKLKPAREFMIINFITQSYI